MNDKFIEDVLKNFFEQGILKCNIYQLCSIYSHAKKQISKNKNNIDECLKWSNLSRMIFTYLIETDVCFTMVNENLKVSFKEFLQKVYGINLSELCEENREYIYDKYVSFVLENCCDKCLYRISSQSCSKCKCGEIWNRIL